MSDNLSVTQSAFGQGWEAKRNEINDPLVQNPYPIADWRYELWEKGWLSYVATDPTKTYDPLTYQEISKDGVPAA